MTSVADTRPPVRWWAALAVTAILVALAAGCSGGDVGGTAAEPPPTPVPTTAAPAVTPTPEATASGAGPTAAPTAVLPAAPAEMAIPFELPNAAGGTVSLDSFLGDRHVVLVFYRTYR